jgi:arylsulfatase A-like enzyme
MSLSRRHFFFGSLALPAFADKKPAAAPPNLLLLVADNLPAWVLGSYGNKEIRTPNLDRLAQMGTRFQRHFACAPSPAPGRATLLSGRTGMQLKSGEAGLDKVLAAAGYACTATDGAGALHTLDSQAAGKPFFLTVNLGSLQPPYEGVAQKYRDLYTQTKFDTFSRDPLAPNSKGGKEMMGDVVGSLRKYAAAVTSMDDEVQAVMARLSERKLLESTLVVFTSSCGALLGRHGIWGGAGGSDPANMYEESVNTPLVWSWLGRVPAQSTRPELVSAYDFVPTFCELAGAERPSANLCGRSYVPMATGKPFPKKEPWRVTIFSALENTGMARIERYKVVVRDGGKGPGELYDLVTDPVEKVNQYDNPQFLTVRNQLSTAFAAWVQKYSA